MSATAATVSRSQDTQFNMLCTGVFTLVVSCILFVVIGLVSIKVHTNTHANLYSELENARWSLTIGEMNTHLDNVLAHLETHGLSNAPIDMFNSEHGIALKYTLLRQIREGSAGSISQLEFYALRDTLQPDHYRFSAEWYDVSHGPWGLILLVIMIIGGGGAILFFYSTL